LAKELVSEVISTNKSIAESLTKDELEMFNDGNHKRDDCRVKEVFDNPDWRTIFNVTRSYQYPFNYVQQAVLDVIAVVEGNFQLPQAFQVGKKVPYLYFSMWRRHLLYSSVRERFNYATTERNQYWKYSDFYVANHVAMFRSNQFSIEDVVDKHYREHYGLDSEYLLHRESPEVAVPRTFTRAVAKRKASNDDEDEEYEDEDSNAKAKTNGSKKPRDNSSNNSNKANTNSSSPKSEKEKVVDLTKDDPLTRDKESSRAPVNTGMNLDDPEDEDQRRRSDDLYGVTAYDCGFSFRL
jgi:hypothetical protein